MTHDDTTHAMGSLKYAINILIFTFFKKIKQAFCKNIISTCLEYSWVKLWVFYSHTFNHNFILKQ